MLGLFVKKAEKVKVVMSESGPVSSALDDAGLPQSFNCRFGPVMMKECCCAHWLAIYSFNGVGALAMMSRKDEKGEVLRRIKTGALGWP